MTMISEAKCTCSHTCEPIDINAITDSTIANYTTLRSMTELLSNGPIKVFVENFLDNIVPEYFKHVPASSSGKYHPRTSLGEAGLVRHTISVVKILNHIVGLAYLQISPLMRDRMIAAAILHDSFKQGLTGATKHTTKDHERVAAEQIILASSEEFKEDGNAIAEMVRRHAGEWGKTVKPRDRFDFLVHLADYLASRTDIVVDVEAPTVKRVN